MTDVRFSTLIGDDWTRCVCLRTLSSAAGHERWRKSTANEHEGMSMMTRRKTTDRKNTLDPVKPTVNNGSDNRENGPKYLYLWYRLSPFRNNLCKKEIRIFWRKKSAKFWRTRASSARHDRRAHFSRRASHFAHFPWPRQATDYWTRLLGCRADGAVRPAMFKLLLLKNHHVKKRMSSCEVCSRKRKRMEASFMVTSISVRLLKNAKVYSTSFMKVIEWSILAPRFKREFCRRNLRICLVLRVDRRIFCPRWPWPFLFPLQLRENRKARFKPRRRNVRRSL